MKIFDKRPLALILCIMLGSFVIFSLLSPILKFLLFILGLLFIVFAAFVLKGKLKFTKICIFCALVSSLFSFLYFDCYYQAYDRYEDEYVEIEGTVTKMSESSYVKSVDIKSSSINGDFCSSYLLHTYLNLDESTNLSVGSKVEICAKITGFASDDAFDLNNYYLSLGYSGEITDIQAIQYMGRSSNQFNELLNRLRVFITIEIFSKTDGEVSGLLTALFLGDSSYLHNQISLDFRRIGISHVLALSGMHLSILILGFSKLLSFLHINKKLRSVFIIIATGFYVALTGFSVSVTRSGVMLIICYLLYLFAFKQDSITSLFIAISLIVILEPYSALSISLWLSGLATLGILSIISDEKKVHKSQSKVSALAHSLTISFFAMYATLLLSCICFDGITYLSVITTLIVSPLTEILLFLVIPLLIFNFEPLSAFANLVGNAVINFAKTVADFEYVYVSDEYVLIEIMIYIFTLLLALFLLFDVKRKRIAFSGLLVFYSVIQITALLLSYQNDITERFDYLAYEESEFLYISNNGSSSVIAIDALDYSSYTELSALVSKYKITEIDNYIVPAYSSNISLHLSRVLGSIEVDTVYLPCPRNENEYSKSSEIANSFENYRAEIIFYELDELIDLGDYHYILTKNSAYASKENDELLFLITNNGRYHTYLNTNIFDTSYVAIAEELMSLSDTVIVGKYHSEEYRFNYLLPKVKSLIIANESIRMSEDTYSFYRYRDIHFYPDRVQINN